MPQCAQKFLGPSHEAGSSTSFLEMHGLICCSSCCKGFNTVSAMRKHAYQHSDRLDKHLFKDCNKSFPFESQLKTHHKTHLTALEHHCIKCTKSFKNRGELVKHQSAQSGKEWRCQVNECGYSCKNPRNLYVHMHTHGDQTQYTCKNCGKGFNHYMQMKR